MAATGKSRVRWSFIHSASADLAWYIGSSLAGWLYYLDSKIWRVRRDPKLRALIERSSVP